MECDLGRYNANAMNKRLFIYLKKIVLNSLWVCFLISFFSQIQAQERILRYHPDGEDFVIVNGNKKFNRALYGTHSAFRIETGDVPELGFFMPNMGGNMQFGLMATNKSLWLNNAQRIESRYRPGTRIYRITDPFLQSGELIITVLAMSDAEGMIACIETKNIPKEIVLLTTFGGAG
ncbi:hypothetical protein EZS27_034430, partial [termite gut metagenome]